MAIVGAGDYIGAEIAKKFASEGFHVHLGRRGGDKLQPLIDEINAAGGSASGRSLDAREPEDVTAFLAEAEARAPLELAIFNVGANVHFPILETTDRVFQKVWQMACFAGFVTGREAARIMLPRKRGKIFFTGATAGLRGGAGYAAFASAKFGIRAVAQSMARELWPSNIHVAHLIIDAGVDTKWVRQIIEQRQRSDALGNLKPDELMPPSAVAEAYWALFQQSPAAWTFEQEIRPYGETW
ncbi:SDR family NAD(P)-dependent oxidoreductase [Sphingobium chlorophenolicum]|uniref:Short-chain dehydrogenase/reductase SDR n=1 Tax=Sphingobium chlorophenolicum TaxID=46429 RepID=A0A081RA18_SPHCR|nr:SDR family NAD(P)-dependent oxidoreductase [Sphingobium chlorophenolicum]KEQ52041.1 Short-chain dehydrogenase/reductase SDR [Sphingobium chlorophenolicum]